MSKKKLATKLEVRRMIVLSTSHLAYETAQQHNSYRETAYLWPIPYGYITWMWDRESLQESYQPPQDLVEVLDFLERKHNVKEGDYIRFDEAGPVLSGLKTYDW